MSGNTKNLSSKKEKNAVRAGKNQEKREKGPRSKDPSLDDCRATQRKSWRKNTRQKKEQNGAVREGFTTVTKGGISATKKGGKYGSFLTSQAVLSKNTTERSKCRKERIERRQRKEGINETMEEGFNREKYCSWKKRKRGKKGEENIPHA